MESLGFCIGASTCTAVTLIKDDNGKISVLQCASEPHYGSPQKIFLKMLSCSRKDGIKIAVTGRKFKEYLKLSSISEPEAVEKAYRFIKRDYGDVTAIVSAGGETFMVYVLNKVGEISSVQSGNKCASGTGEFFLQQIRRMGLSIEEALRIARSEISYKVSGRCSVFCKSDCTHALNKGVRKGRIAAGLCEMMAGKIIEIMRTVPRQNIMIVGGCSRNSVMIDYLKREIDTLIVPPEGPYFEALGTSLWAMENDILPCPATEDVIKSEKKAFFYLPPLSDFEGMVEYKTEQKDKVHAGDRCILGLDVGSTTTKAVLMRQDDDRVLASVYLRTNGDPVKASRGCYASLYEQLEGLADAVYVIGVGVTGSGRHIAGLHAMTRGIINEIIAHAAGALFYDKEVDTIFEIGGQDAKYTYITNGVPCDYAMNEACSAGTGSFLEEAAAETLGIRMEEIAEYAIKGKTPPNFNDQCAAFISSDIKNAFNEGIAVEDIVSGLVYSVCMNYDNRVKGNRIIGEKIFMQGGVCYNRAVPLAMASITGKEIIVPPDPGLIGAFGVAQEVKRRISLGLMREELFSLKNLRDREIEYGISFVCKGGKEKCDRKCEISRIVIDGRTYPFGGACNKWYNARSHLRVDMEQLNLVRQYEQIVFKENVKHNDFDSRTKPPKVIGLNKSFMTNTYFSLYHRFFSSLGFGVILSDAIDQVGINHTSAPFCYPAEIAHGYFADLLRKKPDMIFLPLLKGDYVENGLPESMICPLSQGEPYYLSAAFNKDRTLKKVEKAGGLLNPVINFSQGIHAAEPDFASMSGQLGVTRSETRRAFKEAVKVQKDVFEKMAQQGQKALAELEGNTDEFAVVLFGRAYNAFVPEANMGIPNKFASRNIKVIPFSFLPIGDEKTPERMYWSAGQRILKGARFVKRHSQLFGCYITNFSCGPDSFLLGYFRDMMGKKPSLTLELDSHVADAGLETRIEAFVDIVNRYRELEKQKRVIEIHNDFCPAKVISTPVQLVFRTSQGLDYSIFDPAVHVLFPSMGRFFSEAGAAIFRGFGVRATALPPADDKVLKMGRGNTSCKECLPLQLTFGTLLQYLQRRDNSGELLVYFMPTAGGPCRFGQYSEFINAKIRKLEIENVALFSLSAENSYRDLRKRDLASKLWAGIVIADAFEEIYSMILVSALDVPLALMCFNKAWQDILNVLERNVTFQELAETVSEIADDLARIPRKRNANSIPRILLTGEIYVRHDDLSRQNLTEELARRGFAAKVSTLTEWMYYTAWCVHKGLSTGRYTPMERLRLALRNILMKKYEKTLRKILSRSIFCQNRLEDVDHIIAHTSHLINPALVGEAVLTTGAALNEIIDSYCGVIAIGPFGCMPNRLAESILSRTMNMNGKISTGNGSRTMRKFVDHVEDLPFLAIESDGNLFPQIISAKIEAFLLQAERMHREMMKNGIKIWQ